MNTDAVTEELLDMSRELLKMDALFEIGAEVYKKSVDVLQTHGFTREEAVAIVASQGTLVEVTR